MLRLRGDSAILESSVRSTVNHNISNAYKAAYISDRRGLPSAPRPPFPTASSRYAETRLRTIRRTIDSVSAASRPAGEYVFVDGGSQDGTVAIVESAIAEVARRSLPTRCTTDPSAQQGNHPGLEHRSRH
jgi:hypothetical protein